MVSLRLQVSKIYMCISAVIKEKEETEKAEFLTLEKSLKCSLPALLGIGKQKAKRKSEV